MFLFILFITYAFHYLFVKTDRAMPALARRRWQSCSRAAVPRTQPRRHGRGQDPESGLCGGHGGRRARAGPAAQAPCPASLPQRQSPSPLSSLLPRAPALLRAPRQPSGDKPATLCNLPAERPRTGPGASSAHGIPERGPTHASASYLGPRVVTAPSPRAGPQHFGTQPGTRGVALAHPHTVFLRRLPPCTVFLPLPRCLCWSRVEWGCPCHGPRCNGTVTTRLHPTEGMSIALATRAPHRVFP